MRWDIMSTPFCIHLTRSRTIWANKQKETLSVIHSAFIQCDYILPMDENMRRHDEHTFVYLCNKKTYDLWVKRQGDTIRPPFWIYPTRSRTACKTRDMMNEYFCIYLMKSRTSWCANIRHHEHNILHLFREITYFLQAEIRETWAQHFTPIQRDHAPTVDKIATSYHYHAIIHSSNEITYGLWAKTRWNTMSISLCIDPTRSRTICGRRHEVKPWAHFPDLSDAITHILWVIRWAALICAITYAPSASVGGHVNETVSPAFSKTCPLSHTICCCTISD